MELTTEEKRQAIKSFCLSATGTDPIAILKELMREVYMPMHGPIHHIADGSALLCALHNAGMAFDLDAALDEMGERGSLMPGATCGKWGMCGSASSAAAALAIINGTRPSSDCEEYKYNLMITSRALARMSEIGGPRCCKRNAFISLAAATDVIEEKYGIRLGRGEIACEFSGKNPQCIAGRCPFHRA